MTIRTVLEIPVDDTEFKAFQEKFQKYQDELAKQPGAWGAINKETRQALQSITAALLAQNELHKRLKDDAEELNDTTNKSADAWRRMTDDASSFATRIKDATSSLLKWVGIGSVFSGLVGAGGLWGLDSLADTVNSTRRRALGLGIGYGEQKAFDLNFGRFVDPGFLGNVNQALTDVTKRQALFGAGLSPGEINGRDAAQVGAALLPHLKALADRTPTALLGQVLAARGLDQFVSAEDLQRLKNTSPGEIAGLQRQFEQDRGSFGLKPADQLAWANFSRQMRAAGQSVENTLVVGLSRLTTPLTDLSKGVTDAIAALLKSPTVSHWIDEMAVGLEHFAAYVGTPKFKSDVEGFVANVGALSDSIIAGLKALGIIPGAPKPATSGAPYAPGVVGFAQHVKEQAQANGLDDYIEWDAQLGTYTWHSWKSKANARAGVGVAQDYIKLGLTPMQAAGMAANVAAESGGNPDIWNPDRIHYGLLQWDPARRAKFKAMFGHDMVGSSREEQEKFSLWEITKGDYTDAGVALSEAKSAASAAAGISHLDIKPDHDAANQLSRASTAEAIMKALYAKPKTPPSNRTTVQINNNTGGNAVVTAQSAMGPP